MTTESEMNLATIFEQCLEAKVFNHIEWAWYKYQCCALELGKKADKELYRELAGKYTKYKIESLGEKNAFM